MGFLGGLSIPFLLTVDCGLLPIFLCTWYIPSVLLWVGCEGEDLCLKPRTLLFRHGSGYCGLLFRGRRGFRVSVFS